MVPPSGVIAEAAPLLYVYARCIAQWKTTFVVFREFRCSVLRSAFVIVGESGGGDSTEAAGRSYSDLNHVKVNLFCEGTVQNASLIT